MTRRSSSTVTSIIVTSVCEYAVFSISRMTIKYCSTRGGESGVGFIDVLLNGMARDGGLYIPEEIPKIENFGETCKGKTYREICMFIFSLFIHEDEISRFELAQVINEAYAHFKVAEVVEANENVVEGICVLELFHGPTFAFKDVALQLLGGLFSLVLKKKQRKLLILGATSGDTGSAALAGVVGKENVDCVILYPLGRVSEVQERQMTFFNSTSPGVHAVAVENSTFDDCQAVVKRLMSNEVFAREYSLGAVNSINWVRILAQVVYYTFAVALIQQRRGNEDPVSFVVPTGNFGNILAGYYAKRMGVPINRLIIASNQNDVLPRFFNTGEYSTAAAVSPTLSPSMDICVSSNFERYLYYLFNKDHKRLKNEFEKLAATKSFQVTLAELEIANSDFAAFAITEEETVETMKNVHGKAGYLLCPHSAVGVAAAVKWRENHEEYLVCLATAHVGKFTDSFMHMQGIDEELRCALKEGIPEGLKNLPAAKRKIIEIGGVENFLKSNFCT